MSSNLVNIFTVSSSRFNWLFGDY